MLTKLKDIAIVFLKLGVIGFGGPAAHIAMMEDEVVKRRQWISHEHFLDMLGVTNLIPGPNSTEMAIHIGLTRAGWRGLIVAGICFIAPAIAITLVLAYLYVAYGSLPQCAPLMAGVRPAIIAIILAAVYRLGKQPAVKNRSSLIISLAVALAAYVGANEIVLLFSGGIVAIVWANRNKFVPAAPLFLACALCVPVTLQVAGTIGPADNATFVPLGLFFLKIGSILYGSGYVLVAFLQSGLVDTRHWLTQTQLLDAVAVGQFTPGPVLSTATFIGYVILGIPGAGIATVGIFLPSFVFVLVVSPFLLRLRNVRWIRLFLDGVNASALGLMLAVCVTLGISTLTGLVAWIIVLTAGILIFVWNLHPAWLVAGGALISWLATTIRF